MKNSTGENVQGHVTFIDEMSIVKVYSEIFHY